MNYFSDQSTSKPCDYGLAGLLVGNIDAIFFINVNL